MTGKEIKRRAWGKRWLSVEKRDEVYGDGRFIITFSYESGEIDKAVVWGIERVGECRSKYGGIKYRLYVAVVGHDLMWLYTCGEGPIDKCSDPNGSGARFLRSVWE